MQTTGEFAISHSISLLLYSVGVFGINHHQMTNYKKRYSFGNYFFAKLVTSALMMLICAIVMMFYSTKSIYILLLTLYMMVNSFSEIYQSQLFCENNLTLYGQSLFFRTFFPFVVFAAMLFATRNLFFSLLGINLANLAATFILSVLPSRKYIRKTDYIGNKDFFALLTECLPICINQFLSIFILNSSKYLIDFVGDDVMQGYFAVIFMPAQVIGLFSMIVFMPQLNKYNSYIATKKPNMFYRLFAKHVIFIAAMTVGVALFGRFFGADVLGYIFKVEMLEHTVSIVLIVIVSGFYALSVMLYYLLITLRAQKKMLYCYLLCSVLSVLISAAAIHSMGITGATVSLLISYILLSGILLLLMERCLRRTPNA